MLLSFLCFMGGISEAIGWRLESLFLKTFQGFVDCRKDKVVPDFYNPEFGFWVECKNGNWQWGERLKSDQGRRFERISEPIVYFLGLHTYDHARLKLAEKTPGEMRQILGRWMKVPETYIVTDDIVDAVLREESRLNKKGTIRYCMMKRSVIRHIFEDRSFQRFAEHIPSAHEYFGYDRKNFDWTSRDVPVSSVANLTGVVLRKKEDDRVAEYFAKYLAN